MAYLSEDGSVEYDPDPYVELPSSVTSALEGFILIEDWQLACERIDAIEALLEEGWAQLGGEDDLSGWLNGFEGMPYVLIEGPDGSWIRPTGPHQVEVHKVEIPNELLGILSDDVLTASEPDRSGRMHSLSGLVGEWMGLFVDQEKLLGHLLKAHSQPAQLVGADDVELARAHADIHRAH